MQSLLSTLERAPTADEAWVIAQGALFGALVSAPTFGITWPPALAWLARVVAVPLGVYGSLMSVAAMLAHGTALTPLPSPSRQAPLLIDGPYALVRHPIYSGLCAGSLAAALMTANTGRVFAALALCIFFAAKARREEELLGHVHPGYAAYAARVPRLAPTWPRRPRAIRS